MNRTLIALAPCAFELSAPGEQSNRIDVQLLPAGDFRPRDGRQFEPGQWHIDAAAAAQVIQAFRARANDPVVDYEHQTLTSEDNGRPAPAAGWIQDMQWREGQGLFATVELTDKAAAYIRAGEYRYVSPVFAYDRASGHVLAIDMAAITNNPALDGMQPLALRAAAKFLSHDDEASRMKDLMKLIAGTFDLGDSPSEKEAVAALTAHFDALAEQAGNLRDALALDGKTDHDAVLAACKALKAKAATSSPDPDKYIAVAAFEDVKGQLATLTAQVRKREVDELVAKGLESGQLLATQEQWARDMGAKDLADLKSYLDVTTPIAALTKTQTKGKPPAGEGDGAQLSDDELAVCKATGVDPKDYAASKTEAEEA